QRCVIRGQTVNRSDCYKSRGAQTYAIDTRSNNSWMKQRTTKLAARRKVCELSVIISGTSTDNPGRNRVRIQRICARACVSSRKHNVDAVVGQHLCGNVHRIVHVENGVG